VEDPDFARANGLKIDASYYLDKQLGEPLKALAVPFVPEVGEMLAAFHSRLNNKQSGQREISSFFKPKAAAAPALDAGVSARKRTIAEVSDYSGESEEEECLL
jgi:hypothetical protein